MSRNSYLSRLFHLCGVLPSVHVSAGVRIAMLLSEERQHCIEYSIVMRREEGIKIEMKGEEKTKKATKRRKRRCVNYLGSSGVVACASK